MPPPSPHNPHGDPSPPKPNTKLLSLILKSIIMVFITSLFFLLMGIASLLLIPLLLASLHRHHHNHPSSDAFCTKRLKKLPQFKLSKITETHSGNDCVVCLDGFKQGQWCRKLVGCGHVFHRKCVDTWLVKVPACPICRSPVQLEDDKQEFWATFGGRRRNYGFRLY